MKLTSMSLGLCSLLLATNAFAVRESVPGEYLIKLKNNYSISSVGDIKAQLGFLKATLPNQNIILIKRPVFETEGAVIQRLKKNPMIEIIEPNYIYHPAKTPNDPLLGQLWGLQNTGQKDSQGQVGIPGMDIQAIKAWEIETGSKNVVVAVIDTGIDYNHPDLKDNLWTNDAELHGKAGVDDDGNGIIDDIYGANFTDSNNPTGENMDDDGHGTHCSGIIGAKGNDNKGLVGVNWDVRIMGVKSMKPTGGTLEGAIRAIDYATQMGAKILSNSWGGGDYSELLKQAIERSHKAGALFVVAAGNESNDNDAKVSYPASYNVPNMLVVAAIDNQGKMPAFSNFGKSTVDIAAPGVNILSSIINGSYDSWSGTSMATPFVAGVAALLAAHDPQLTNLEMKERIINTSNPLIGVHGRIRAGAVDAFAALSNKTYPKNPDDPVYWKTMDLTVSSPHPVEPQLNLTYEVHVPGAKQFSLYFDRLETDRHDIITFYDASGKQLAQMSGNFNQSFSPVIDGDYVKLIFTSCCTTDYYGWNITKAAWR